jgi:hypothetical protein
MNTYPSAEVNHLFLFLSDDPHCDHRIEIVAFENFLAKTETSSFGSELSNSDKAKALQPSVNGGHIASGRTVRRNAPRAHILLCLTARG